MSMSPDSDLVLMDKQRLTRSLNRMAHEIAEQNPTDRPVVLFGINERGYMVANGLADILQSMFHQVHSFQLLVNDGDQPFSRFGEAKVENPFVLVVDDVIFSGQTMFNALQIISEHINPPEIHTAVLIDRGHRKFPVKAEYYGMELPTKLNEHVSVMVDEAELKEVKLVNSKK